MRDAAAARRDRLAAARDAAAHARDRLADALDAEIERLEREMGAANGGSPIGLDVLVGAGERGAASRARAAAQRKAAADDRRPAAADRRQAALDRRAAAEEPALEGHDHLTGALRRGVGLGALQRELDRTRRTGERLAIAFVDVDGLKRVNDTTGHAAGDALLRSVADSIMQHLRRYDVMVRYGGDEFVCSLSGVDAASARRRFDEIATRLREVASGATLTVGIADRGDDDALDELIRRADAAMIHARERARARGRDGASSRHRRRRTAPNRVGDSLLEPPRRRRFAAGTPSPGLGLGLELMDHVCERIELGVFDDGRSQLELRFVF